MADFRTNTAFFTHTKTIKLKRAIGSDGVLCLLQLWAYATEHRSRGVLSDMDADDIEIAAGWGGEPGALIQALLNVRFLDEDDGQYSLHNWKERNPYAYHAEDRSTQAKRAIAKRWEQQRNTASIPPVFGEHEDSNTPLPVPSPSPAPEPKPKTAAAPDGFDFSIWPSKPSAQVLADWFRMRKRLKADVTQTVINRLGPKLHAAVAAGYSVDDCIGACVERNWRGFEVSWMPEQPQRAGVNYLDGVLNPEGVTA